VGLDDIHDAAQRLLEAGGGQFTYEWNAPRRSDGRLVLSALAELTDSAASWMDAERIAARAGLGLEPAEEALRDLMERDLVLGASRSFRLRVDLFRQWLRREWPVARARAEAS